jgi:hypothetical protein
MAELPERLHEAAGAHRPDRERMLARVERAMASPGPGRANRRWGRPSVPWMRVTAVAAAAAGAIGLGGLAVGAVAGHAAPGRAVVTSGSTAAATRPPAAGPGAGTAAGRPAPPRHAAGGTGRHGGSAVARRPEHASVPPAGARAVTGAPPVGSEGAPDAPPPAPPDNGVSARGAVDGSSSAYWTQSDLTLTSDRPLTSLAVVIRVARTTGVDGTGSYDSASGGTTASVTVEGDYLVYRWALAAGQTLAPGSYTFAGRFQHAGGDRDTSGDTYAAEVDGPGGPAAVGGKY